MHARPLTSVDDFARNSRRDLRRTRRGGGEALRGAKGKWTGAVMFICLAFCATVLHHVSVYIEHRLIVGFIVSVI
jgi:hypothetical protein